MIKSWVFTFLKPLGRVRNIRYDQAAAQETYDFHLDMLPLLEELGFEGVFFSEHHFHGNLSPSPNLMIAAAAQRTQRLRLGVMGQVLPLYPPHRVAEEIGMLNLLTHGRLEIGYSSGAGPMEPVAAGVPKDEIRPRYEEALEVVERFLREERVSHGGKYYGYEKLSTTPRPLPASQPPRWVTVLGAASAADAAKRGFRICTGFLSIEAMKPVFDAYREAALASGNPAGPDQLGIRRQILVWDNDDEAQSLGKELKQLQIDEVDRRVRSILQPDAEPGVRDVPDIPSSAGLYSAADECIFGSPASVAERIIDQCRATGAGHMLAYTFSGLDAAELTHSLRLWKDVIPQLAKAGLPMPAQLAGAV